MRAAALSEPTARWFRENGRPGEGLVAALARKGILKAVAPRIVEVCCRNLLPLPPLEILATPDGQTWLVANLVSRSSVTPPTVPIAQPDAFGVALTFGDDASYAPWTDADSSSQNGLRTAGHYLLGTTLGIGVGSIVRSGVSVYGGPQYAVKIIPVNRLDRQAVVDRLLWGSEVASRLQLASILHYHETGWEAGKAYLVLPLRRNSVHDLCLRQKFSQIEATEVCYQAAQVLALVHAAGQVHGNIKPSNVLIGSESIEFADLSAPAEALDPGYVASPEARQADVQNLLSVYGSLLASSASTSMFREFLVTRFSTVGELVEALEPMREALQDRYRTNRATQRRS
ncbi:hypothetical protein FRUB_01654 [Fimbriiglobus ruber]|uniref:Protein kinase domain-containing protein n=1 Tax=Fimbriiglobus ruber TaxID=1908690 RepID=A0A225DWA0_9BACT|nr:hypothetical protein FRUB_01654 [Fimbriiglobus ruber]